MSYIKISPQNLFKQNPGASCCDCSKEVAEAVDNDEENQWVIYNKNIIYCPKCATYQNLY